MVQDEVSENGYILLEECEVFSRRGQDLPVSKWMEVILQQENSSDDSSASSDTDCTHCKLIVDSGERSNSPLSCIAGIGLRFEGTIQDAKPDRGVCRCQRHLQQRTDAALVVGLALTCQDYGYASIKSMHIIVQDKKHSDNDRPRDDYRRLASLYITFHIPEIHQNRETTKIRRFLSSSAKALPPSTQLLLSLIRSDWDFLDDFILQRSENTSISREIRTRRHHLTLFPPKLSLEEVYKRIRGAVCALEEADFEKSVYMNKADMCLVDLPKDILKHHVAVYLKARSLDSLRRTCRTAYRTLRSVVPGLKLQLYAHQIKSLSWMRNREVGSTLESDLVSYTARRAHSQEGDVHRAASGGATVLLSDRSGKRENIHVSQCSGDEVPIVSDDPLSRTTARGGLLCDDPGLGKTITVVSLVLQTLGLSTESSGLNETISDSSKNGDTDNSSDEQIFVEYWKESTIQEYRTRDLNKFLNDFQRSHHDTRFFVNPVDPIADDCPDYLEVVEEPISILDIRKKIASNSYADSFSAFEIDMKTMLRYVWKHFMFFGGKL
eukprot:scaffold2830_cov131-Cylindrotheca_fusiformis.AAC.74